MSEPFTEVLFCVVLNVESVEGISDEEEEEWTAGAAAVVVRRVIVVGRPVGSVVITVVGTVDIGTVTVDVDTVDVVDAVEEADLVEELLFPFFRRSGISSIPPEDRSVSFTPVTVVFHGMRRPVVREDSV